MYDKYRRILDSCRPYVVASEYSKPFNFEAMPFGLELDPALHFDPLKVSSSDFLHILQRLDELTFGPVGMPMPRWVFYDCAEVPGGILGFARPAAQMPEWVRRALDVKEDYDGYVPVSMYVAIPMLSPGHWHTYTLCSLNQVSPGAAPAGIARFSEAVGLATLGVEVAYGATQWRSPTLHVHACFGPLDLVTAWTPAHSDPSTLTFRFPVTRDRIERAVSYDEMPLTVESSEIRWVDCDEPDELRTLQREIEAGRRFQVVGGSSVSGSFTRVPIREIVS